MNWPKVRLGDVCEVRAGRDYRDVQSDDGAFPIYGTGGIMGRSTEARCPANSVIVGRKGTLDNPMLIREPFWNIDTCFGVIPNDKLDAEYLWRFCQKFDFYSLVPASGRPSTTSDAIKAIQLPLPELAEQRKIAASVDKAMKRVDAIERQFEKLRETAAACFKAELKAVFDAIGRAARPAPPNGETADGGGNGQRGGAGRAALPRMVRLGDICENCDGRRIPVTKSDRKAGPFPYYGASGVVDHVSDYLFDGDYLLVSEDGANLFARSTPIAFSVSGKIWVNNHAHVLRFDDMRTQRFVELWFSAIDISDSVTGAAQPKLTQKALNDIMVPCVPLQVQGNVVARLDAAKARCDGIAALATRGLANCARMRKAILAEAFAV